MPWNNEHMLTDADGNLIPQVWDPSQNKFVPYEAKVQLSGSTVAYSNRMCFPISSPVELTIPTYDGSGQAVHPSVVRIPGKLGGYEYWMAMTPYANGNAALENPSIVASNDGITWVVPDGLSNPVAGPSEDVQRYFYCDPELVYEHANNRLVLWYRYIDRTGEDSRFFKRTSVDGVTWSEETVCSIGGAAIDANPNAFGIARDQLAGQWYMWESAMSTTYAPLEINRLVSTDGTTWYRGEHIPLMLGGRNWHMSVFDECDGYHFLFSAYPRGQNGTSANHGLWYGFSRDGYRIETDGAPLLLPDSGFTADRIYRSCMVRLNADTYRVYISASANNVWKIGFFDVRMTGYNWKVPLLGEKRRDRLVIPLIRNWEIRDTNAKQVNYGVTDPPSALKWIPTWHNFSRRRLLVHSSLDQVATVSLVTDTRSGLNDTITISAAQTAQQVNVPASSLYKPTVLTATDLPILDGPISGRVGITIKCNVAPTAGSLSAWLIMGND